MALNDINKDELQDFAEAKGVDSSGNKADVVARLEQHGFTEDDVVAFQEGTEEPAAAEQEPEAVVPSGETAEEANARVEQELGIRAGEDEARQSQDEGEKILIKLVGPYSSLRTKGVFFTQEHPFVPVSREVADELLESSAFRQAHPSEAESYYS